MYRGTYWNWLLLAVAHHELLTAGEDWLSDVLWVGGTLVDDDGDSRRVVDEVLGESGLGLLEGVSLDQALEGRGNVLSLLPPHALPRWAGERLANAARTLDALSAWDWLLLLCDRNGLRSGGWCWCGDGRASKRCGDE